MIEKLYKCESKPREVVKAVTENHCNRCFGTNLYQDAYGHYHCLECFQYGEISDRMMIYRYKREIKESKHIINMDYDLTDLQKEGSKFLLDCFKNNESGFLQAVCGAGKTEMTYEAILYALKDNKRICFVIPRVEVLKEVYQRFTQAFPKTNIKVLYEGNKNYQDAQLLFSTPQQLIYFYHEFDLIILDEVDAFPFAGNEFLKRLVKKSKAIQGITLYMSATLASTCKNDLKKVKTYMIPSRYHHKPLVIPTFINVSNEKKLKKRLMPYLINNQTNRKKTLVFVPTIKIGKAFLDYYNQKHFKAAFICSQTKYKKEIINHFRKGLYDFLLTTTVLERGVTFSNIDCFILYADHKVYTKESLIQISGRVGRDKTFTNGQLIFFSTYKSQAMNLAKNEMIYMNLLSEQHEV